jgi:uncharacterized protein (DUF1800 family)
MPKRNRPLRWMSRFLLLLVPLAAQAAPMGEDDARHLLNRAGFGAAPREVASYATLTRAQAVERLLGDTRTAAQSPPPEWVSEPIVPPRKLRGMAPEARKEFVAHEIQRGLDLRAWWINEMITTPSQLTERMTLFWHNHFVSSQRKVRFARLMYEQNRLLRRNAAGNFGTLLHEVGKDPAMVIYLDSAQNRKGKPNENFAREVMELFTLGEGHYTENDIREAARAFTGWSIDIDTGEFKFRRFAHDGGSKTVLGRSGDFDGDDVLDILLAKPETAQFVVTKLWREFVSPEPDAAEVRRIADTFYRSHYDVKTALRGIFLSPAFWTEANRAALVKSPVDLVVGTVRQFEIEYGDPIPFALVSAQLGQNLFAPPNVRGWPGGDAWINSSTLLARKTFIERVFRAEDLPRMAQMAVRRQAAKDDPREDPGIQRVKRAARERFVRAMGDIRFDANHWSRDFVGPPTRAEIERVVLAQAPVNPVADGTPVRELLKQLALDPAYQLK